MVSIPLAPFEKLLKEAGAKRVSKSATKAFVDFLEEVGMDIGREAADLARHAGRKTVVDADINLVRKRRR